MKFLLTSAGIKNPTINDAMVELLGKPVSECDALCVPTASYGHAPRGIHGAYRFITGEATTPMCELGWEVGRGMLELDRAAGHRRRARGSPWVREAADVLLVDGGDALYLAHWMRESGLRRPAAVAEPTRSGWALSAGSMVMTPRIGDDFVRDPPEGGDRTLGLVDFSIFPHLGHDRRRTRWRPPSNGRPRSAARPTRSTTRPPSRSSTARSRSSPRGSGGSSR